MARPFTQTERDAEIWRLRTVEGYSHNQIAQHLRETRKVVSMAWLRMVRRLGFQPNLPRRPAAAPKRAARPEAPRDIILRLSLVEPPLTVERIAEMTGFSDGLVRVTRRRLRAAGHRIPLVLRDGNANALDLKATITGDRCKCGLLLPCNSCLPTATELATRRSGPIIPEQAFESDGLLAGARGAL